MKKVIVAALVLAPSFAFAQTLGNIETLIKSIGNLVEIALPIVVALGLIGFFWGLVKYIFAQGDETAKTDAKRIMLWGVVALFVMVSVWGLVRFVGNAFGINQGGTVTLPSVPGI